ncbi:MAG: hypothetical protein IT346_04735 [Epsilonproteobacteria bacterium]|nr:hypothetical protein [Campylobacterota bacterium]
MNIISRISIVIFCIILGALFCAYQNGWFIICLPFTQSHVEAHEVTTAAVQKKVLLSWWHNASWHIESSEIVWPADTSCALYALVKAWLVLLDEEQENAKPVAVQTAMLPSGSTTAYISFDRNPFGKQDSVYAKLRWFDGLSKSITSNGLSCTHIQLLVQHKPLLDVHVDFSHPWPVASFIE